MVELGDNEAGRGGDYESALDCLICFIRQSHSSQDHEFNHIPLISICHKKRYYCAYLIFVIFFTLAKFLENKIYTEKRQFFALNL